MKFYLIANPNENPLSIQIQIDFVNFDKWEKGLNNEIIIFI